LHGSFIPSCIRRQPPRLAPLAYGDLPGGEGAFIGLSQLAYLGSIWLLLTRLTPLPAAKRTAQVLIIISCGYLATYYAAIATLALGQINLLALSFSAGARWACGRRRGPFLLLFRLQSPSC
jgi:hypothetical protein